jgi:hypothetical protein
MLETTNQVGVYCHSQDFQFDFLIITYITGIKGESRVVSMVLSIKHGVQTYVPWSKDGINGLNMVIHPIIGYKLTWETIFDQSHLHPYGQCEFQDPTDGGTLVPYFWPYELRRYSLKFRPQK